MCSWKWLAIVAAFGMTTGVAYAQHPLEAPWQQTDVGDVGLAGSASESSDADLRMAGAGADIWGTADSFHFVYQTMWDGEIGTNRGSFFDPPGTLHPHAKLGIMIRSTLAPDSPHVVLDMQPDGSVEFMQRAVAGGETTFIAGIGATGHAWWLHLVRAAGVVTAYACATSCQTIGTASFPDGPALVGPVITSHDRGVLAHGGFDASPPYVYTLPLDWFHFDVGDVGVRGGAYYNGRTGTFIVQGAGADIWGTSDSYQLLNHGIVGDGSIVARVVSEDAANTFAKAGVAAFYPTGQVAVILDARPNGVIEFMARSASGGAMQFIAGSASAFPMWLKLRREGNQFTGYMSTDGSAWQFVGSTTVSIGNRLDAGLAVTSHDTTVLNTAMFDHVMVVSDALQDIDIGDVGAAGGSTPLSNTSASVSGSGADIWGSTDAFHYYYASLVNDGRLYAQVNSLDNTDSFAKAGIMIRSSTDPSAPHVILDVKPDGGIEFMTRTAQGGQTTYLGGTTRAFPVQLELERSGSTITAWVIDGAMMTKLGSVSVDLPSDALIGLAVTSHQRGTLATATFQSISR